MITSDLLSERKVILDPFARLPEDLYENFLIHLSGKDILTLSKVSQRCDGIISDNKRCLDKITIVFSEATKNLDVDILQREYRHLKVYGLMQSMKASCGHNNLKMIQLCEKVSKTVTSIEVRTMMMDDLKSGTFEWSFNELQELRIMLLNEFLVKCFTSASKLKSLVIGSTFLKPQDLVNFLKCFPNLESLEMKFNIFEVLFSQDVSSDVNFKLKKVKAQKTYNGRTTRDENYERFLLSQEGSLKEIEFVNIANAETINMIFKSLQVQTMIINFVDGPMNLNPQANKSVTTLHIKNDDNCTSILKASPNLKNFHIQKLSTDLVEFLATEMMKLEEVSYVEADERLKDVAEYYTKFVETITKPAKVNAKINFLKVKQM